MVGKIFIIELVIGVYMAIMEIFIVVLIPLSKVTIVLKSRLVILLLSSEREQISYMKLMVSIKELHMINSLLILLFILLLNWHILEIQ